MKLPLPRWAIAVLLLAFTVIVAGVVSTFGVGLTNPADASKDDSKRPAGISMHSGPSWSARAYEWKPEESPFRFESMTEQSGIDFVYYGSPTRDASMTEQNGGGVALLDYDRDGQLDLFFANGSSFRRPAAGLAESNRMYRSVGGFRYEDVTEAAGLVAHGFGMGVAAGDYDNDGFTDQFVASYGRDRLWRNNGDGTFTEVTEAAGIGGERWGTSAAMADLDGDGLLDLYVVNYVDWLPSEPPCHPADHPEINNVCSPTERSGQPDALYHNRGEGHFDEIGAAAGVSRVDGKGLALTIADFDRDSRLDVYVVNDTAPKYLFRNLGGMRFEEIAAPTGAAIGGDGTIGSGMGVACADIDHNGRLDLCVTNFRHQVNDVYANMDHGGFEAVNAKLGVDLYSRSARLWDCLRGFQSRYMVRHVRREWPHLGPDFDQRRPRVPDASPIAVESTRPKVCGRIRDSRRLFPASMARPVRRLWRSGQRWRYRSGGHSSGIFAGRAAQ